MRYCASRGVEGNNVQVWVIDNGFAHFTGSPASDERGALIQAATILNVLDGGIRNALHKCVHLLPSKHEQLKSVGFIPVLIGPLLNESIHPNNRLCQAPGQLLLDLLDPLSVGLLGTRNGYGGKGHAVRFGIDFHEDRLSTTPQSMHISVLSA